MTTKTDKKEVCSARPIALSIERRILATGLFLIMIMASLLVTSNAEADSPPVQIGWMDQFGSGLSCWDFAFAVDYEGNAYVSGYVYGILFGQPSAGCTDAFIRKYNSDGNEVWTRQFGSATYDYAYSLSVYSSGVYVAGETDSALPGQTSAGYYDAFVRKYDVDGTLIWTRQFGTTSYDCAYSVSADASGVYVAGFTSGVFFGQSSAGGNDVFVQKYDLDGTPIWTRQFGSSSDDKAKGLSACSSGVYVTGTTSGTLPGQTAVGGPDAFVRKYDTSGATIWTRQFGTTSADNSNGISANADGAFVSGETEGIFPSQTGSGWSDAFLRKFDANGNAIWTKQFGTVGYDQGIGVSVGALGVYVIGLVGGTLPGQTSAGNYDVFARMFDFGGNVVWTKQFGTSAYDEGNGISADASGVYVTGRTSGTFSGQTSFGSDDCFVSRLDGGGAVVWTKQFGSGMPTTDFASAADSEGNSFVTGRVDGIMPGQSSAGSTDAFIRMYNPNGNMVWTRQFGTSSYDYAYGVSIDTSGAYVAGYTGGVFPGQWNAGAEDAFVRKYDFSGTVVWTREFGSSDADWTSAISVDSSGVYVTGLTSGTFPGQTSAGSWDVFVQKYDASGNAVWTKQFGTTDADYAGGISVGTTGVYVAGYTYGVFPGQTSSGILDAYVRKLDLDGNSIWTKQFGTSGYDFANGVSVDATGVYVAGTAAGPLPGQVGYVGFIDAFIRKYDSSGSVVWTRQFGTPGEDYANGISVVPTGVYVAGHTNSVFSGQTSAGGIDAFTCKYDSNGNQIWTKQFGTYTWDSASGVAGDPWGVVVVGATNGVLPGEASYGSRDAFVTRFVENTPPNAVIDLISTNYLTVALSGAASTDDTGITSYAWTFGDGQSGSGEEVTHTYQTDGTYIVTLTVTDSAGFTDTESIPVTVAHQPLPPTAAFTWSAVWEEAAFDASLSNDPDGTLTEWAWDFGDGAVGSGMTVAHTYSASGSYLVTLTVTDNEGLTASASDVATVILNNPPVPEFSVTKLYLHVSVDASQSTDDIGISSYEWSFGDGGIGSGVTDSHTYASSGTYEIVLTVTDIAGKSATTSKSVTVVGNAPPTILSFTASPETISEGSSVVLEVVATDSNGDPITYLFDFEDDGVFDVSGSSNTASHVYPENGVFSVRTRASDGSLCSDATTSVVVLNSAPIVTINSPSPGTVVAVGIPVSFTGQFDDPGIEDTHTAIWILDSSTIVGTVTETDGCGSVQDTFTFSSAGVYGVRLAVTDDDGGVGVASTVGDMVAFVVVYDPTAGFVTGGGWIDSPLGAYAADPTLSGRATFGFVSKYQKGAKIPTGETEFQFRVANLNFHSSAYDWLVVSGSRAQYKGTGTINGQGDYGFVLTVIDGSLPGGGGMDRFRIKIWDRTTDVIVYDNQMGEDDFADPTTVASGGSVVIHKQ